MSDASPTTPSPSAASPKPTPSSPKSTNTPSTPNATNTPNTNTIPSSAKKIQEYSYEEVDKHNSKTDKWIAIHGKVYNITAYIAKHPGGEEILFEGEGDRGSNFEDIGHSSTARNIMEEYYIGNVANYVPPSAGSGSSEHGAGASNRALPLALVVLAVLVYFVFFAANKVEETKNDKEL